MGCDMSTLENMAQVIDNPHRNQARVQPNPNQKQNYYQNQNYNQGQNNASSQYYGNTQNQPQMYSNSVQQQNYQYQHTPMNQKTNQNSNYSPVYPQQNQPQINTYQPSNQFKVQSVNKINTIDKKSSKVIDRKGIMQLYLNKKQSFLTHHLKNQISITKYAKGDYIRRRQILEHSRFQTLLCRGYGQNINIYNQYLMKSYFQRVALEIFETADKQFFQENKSIDQVRFKIAQRYLFELFQYKQFLDAGLDKYTNTGNLSQLSMSSSSTASDSALYPILKFLKDKYPQVADKSTITFPTVKQKKNDVNLLQNFDSKCFSSQKLINVQTLFSDLKFMVDKSIQQFSDFQSDMKFLLGDEVLTDSKVKKNKKNGKQQYSASPIRRVFIKWAQTILERIPDLIYTQAFIQFIRSKSQIADNFYFKSTVQATTHIKVIQFLCKLLETAKYEITTLIKKKQFGFYIYDLLRCKIKRNSGQQIVQVLNKMQQTKNTPSGKKFQVIRIKDRFKTPNRDLMVNFRYGDVIIAEAQLCIDTSDVSQKTKKTNKFNHYIYQLERGLFGPTIQLIMQYEDFQRKDISANLQAQGIVQKRISKKPLTFLKKANRKCFSNHDMIQMKGNYFIKDQDSGYKQNIDMSCDFCSKYFSSNQLYHYCYFCTIVFCTSCTKDYQTKNPKDLQLRCNKDEQIQILKNQQDLKNSFKQSPIVLFYLSSGAPNIVYKDFITFLFCTFKMKNIKIPKLYFYCCDNNDSDKICDKYDIKQFPTTILFSNDGTAQTKLLGCQINYIQGFIQAQTNISNGQLKALPLTCICGQSMNETPNQEDQEFYCVYCGNVDKSNGFFDALLGQDNSRVFVCGNGHIRCLKCSFLGDNYPSQYKDYRAKSYMSTKKFKIQQKCQKGHKLIHIRDTGQSKDLNCMKCSKIFFFNDVQGAGHCSSCNIFICPKCIGIEDYSIQICKSEFINHTVQSTAQEGQRCICKRLFKKVYKTRDYTKSIAQVPQGQDRIPKFVEAIFAQHYQSWKCILCQRTKQDGQLHLACYLCPYFKNDMKINIQICIECAIGSDMLNNQLQQKITQVETDYVCKNNHSIVKTRLTYGSNDMTFDCIGCKKIYYIYSQRYYCKQCKSNICPQTKCIRGNIIIPQPPLCQRKCKGNHKLIIKEGVDTLRMCDGCKTVVKKRHYCCQECQQEYCLKCAATPQGVNTTNNRMQHIDQEKLRKQMEEYQRGYAQYQQQEDQNQEQQQKEINFNQVFQFGW